MANGAGPRCRERMTQDDRDRPAAMRERGGGVAIQQQRLGPESRWPVLVTMLAWMAVLLVMPERLRLLPHWAVYLAAIAVLAPLLAVAIRPTNAAFKQAERGVTLVFVVFAATADLTVLRMLIGDILRNVQAVSGIQLLASSVAVWIGNVVTFSVLYWQMDRGGPIGRESAAPGRPDWVFAEEQVGEDSVGPHWRPEFIDYLFLGFSTATAFSTTDTLPLTRRAKLAMMAESAVSLLIMVVVAARAINVLA
jgi:hypothetical protein